MKIKRRWEKYAKEEIWIPLNLQINNFDAKGYFASNKGRVMNFDGSIKIFHLRKKTFRPWMVFDFRNKESQKRINKFVHCLIWYSFYPETPDDYSIHHIDGNKANNELSNLQAMTTAEHNLVHGKVEPEM
jgi:hypothetical protein